MKQISGFTILLLCLSTIACKKYKLSDFTDPRDGEEYTTVTIGGQTWLAENLRFNATGSLLNPDNPSEKYGRLYDWEVLMQGAPSSSANPSGVQGVCPEGWHLPSIEEWTALKNAIASSETVKEMRATSGWYLGGDGSNKSGFNALPAGFHSGDDFSQLGQNSHFWTTESDSTISANAWEIDLNKNSNVLEPTSDNKEYAYSCRCVQD